AEFRDALMTNATKRGIEELLFLRGETPTGYLRVQTFNIGTPAAQMQILLDILATEDLLKYGDTLRNAILAAIGRANLSRASAKLSNRGVADVLRTIGGRDKNEMVFYQLQKDHI